MMSPASAVTVMAAAPAASRMLAAAASSAWPSRASMTNNVGRTHVLELWDIGVPVGSLDWSRLPGAGAVGSPWPGAAGHGAKSGYVTL